MLSEERQKLLTQQFKEQVHDLGREIDPGDEHDWHSLTLGWALAQHLSVEDAQELALHIRYHTPWG